MSDLTLLAAALTDLYTGGAERDTGAGAPARVPGHEADRLAALPRAERRFRFAPRRRVLRRA
ncbi:hypothetical protein ACIRBX_32500 [Kitasatospora sp. NPDC096147]|uniref:hypothetical protein n=1 Tax=Kitasatospora sp. NPDC096147 TaxID=3364093 RepID=UPI003810C4E9